MRKSKYPGILKLMEMRLTEIFLGEGNAGNRQELLEYLQKFFPELEDRKMRQIYGDHFPIGHAGKRGKGGIFLIDDPDEIDRMVKLMRKKIDTYDFKIARFLDHKRKLIKLRSKEWE